MQLLRTIHAYVGLVLGVLLVIFSLTGGALIFKENFWRAAYPALQQPLVKLTASDYAAGFAAAQEELAGEVTAFFVPRDGVPAYHLYTPKGEALLEQTTHSLIDTWRWHESITGVLTEVHFRLLAGAAGKKIGGFLALLSCLMAISGIFLWWPGRRGFRAAHLAPRGIEKRVHLIRLHRDLGILTAFSLILFSATAAGVIFAKETRLILNTLISDRPPEAFVRVEDKRMNIFSPAKVTQVKAALAALPDAMLTAYYPPTANRAAHYFRFKQPGERHPNGRSAVYVDSHSAEVLQIINAARQPTGERLYHFMYPLHAAKMGGLTYAFFAFASAFAISVIAIAGFLAFLKRRPLPAKNQTRS